MKTPNTCTGWAGSRGSLGLRRPPPSLPPHVPTSPQGPGKQRLLCGFLGGVHAQGELCARSVTQPSPRLLCCAEGADRALHHAWHADPRLMPATCPLTGRHPSKAKASLSPRVRRSTGVAGGGGLCCLLRTIEAAAANAAGRGGEG